MCLNLVDSPRQVFSVEHAPRWHLPASSSRAHRLLPVSGRLLGRIQGGVSLLLRKRLWALASDGRENRRALPTMWDPSSRVCPPALLRLSPGAVVGRVAKPSRWPLSSNRCSRRSTTGSWCGRFPKSYVQPSAKTESSWESSAAAPGPVFGITSKAAWGPTRFRGPSSPSRPGART